MIAIITQSHLYFVLDTMPNPNRMLYNLNLVGIDLIKRFYAKDRLIIPANTCNPKRLDIIDEEYGDYNNLPEGSIFNDEFMVFSEIDGEVSLDIHGLGGHESSDLTHYVNNLGNLSNISNFVYCKSNWLAQQLSALLSEGRPAIEQIESVIRNLTFCLDKITTVSIKREDISTSLKTLKEEGIDAAIDQYWDISYPRKYTKRVELYLDTIPVFNEDNLLGNPNARCIE